MSKSQHLKIEIGHRSIIFTILFILFLYILFEVKGILITVFIAYLLSTSLYPLVNSLHRFHIPRQLSAGVIILMVASLVITLFASIVPLVITQTTAFLHGLPDLIESVSFYLDGFIIDQSFLNTQLTTFSGNLFKIALNTFSISLSILTVFIICYYFILERANLDQRLRQLFGDQAEKNKKLFLEIEKEIGQWLRTVLLLMFLVGLATYIGLFLIGIDYALPLAIIAGLLEIIPNLGPTVAAVPAAIVGFATSPVHGLLTIGLSVLVQQAENNLLVPTLMKRQTGLHPVVVIISLLVGFQLGGALLAVLAIPIVLIAKIVLTHLYTEKKLTIQNQ